MDRSVKAALLSGLVFPGVGQLFLGLRLRGWLFLLPAAAAAIFFVSRVWAVALQVSEDILAARIAPDLPALVARVHEQAAGSSGPMNWAAGVMIVCWVASTADAWFAGRRLPAAP